VTCIGIKKKSERKRKMLMMKEKGGRRRGGGICGDAENLKASNDTILRESN
jgi:hypothetical protein